MNRDAYASLLLKTHRCRLYAVALEGPADGSEAVADDLANDAITALAMRPEPILEEPAQCAYLRKCLTSLRASEIRKQQTRRTVSLDEVDEEATAPDASREGKNDEDFVETLSKHFALLTSTEQEVLRAWMAGNPTHEEIGRQLGKGRQTVTGHLSNALTKLRRSMSRDSRLRESLEDRGYNANLSPPPPEIGRD
ncbi:MAG: sigma-70 family RNA polymerase sigma factor [Planctomycetes bacterium]|nr:sigma-70 family RNA polymerase sigma factor [Planctomycetota bacterium]